MNIKGITKSEQKLIMDSFGLLDIHEDENPRSKFYVGILDRFNRVLNYEEAGKHLITYSFDSTIDQQIQSNYLEQEVKYLNFFNFVYEMNGELPVYVYSPDIFDLKEKTYSSAIKHFNDEERQLLKILHEDTSIKDGIYKVENKELLYLFAKLSLRELCFSNFFFNKASSVIIGNYELNFPIYCLNEFTMVKYEKIANQVGLFIRK